ncbi:hypothetical protein [Alteraurantiacibacter palmitatis]|uniref:Uncharacterized protein n=1 Tax=Alteraurantiacibacter palmitatis TaxID=2054628 RepID=A0ABV7EAB6_9SPHN
MRVHPAIAALRSDRAPQRQAQAAMQAALDGWRAEPDAASVLAQFREFGCGARLEECPALDAMFTGQGAAEALMASLVRHFCGGIAAHPLAHPPFRNGFDGKASSLLLARSGRASLVLQAREPGSYAYSSVTFFDDLRYEAVLAGRAEAGILRIHGPVEKVRFTEEALVLEGGVRLGLACTDEALRVTRVERRLVTLCLVQASATPNPAREYDRDTGRLLHLSAGSLATSRREMMAALLGRMQRRDAAPVLAGMVEREHDRGLRWQALRECLALDTAQGFAALTRIARDPADSLYAEAAALYARLLEDYPQLGEVEIA